MMTTSSNHSPGLRRLARFRSFHGAGLQYEGQTSSISFGAYGQRPQGRLGTVGILGNHDLWFQLADDGLLPNGLRRSCALSGVTLLRNQAAVVGGIQFIGIDDLWSPCFDPERCQREESRRLYFGAVSLTPMLRIKPVWSLTRVDLVWHTHGGQCKPPFLPPPLVPVKNSAMWPRDRINGEPSHVH